MVYIKGYETGASANYCIGCIADISAMDNALPVSTGHRLQFCDFIISFTVRTFLRGGGGGAGNICFSL